MGWFSRKPKSTQSSIDMLKVMLDAQRVPPGSPEYDKAQKLLAEGRKRGEEAARKLKAMADELEAAHRYDTGLRQVKADPGERKMVLLLEELRRADEASKRDIRQSIEDLYLGITTNFRTIEGLKAAPSGQRREFVDLMLALEERMIKADMHGWAITRLFNKWVLASILDKQEDATRLAYDLAFFMPDYKFPPLFKNDDLE